jgi:DUF4097 and DUF4098 domain-containing protein YvlB
MMRRVMPSLVALAVFAACAGSAHAQAKINRGQRLSSDGAVRIYNLVGSVRVIGWKRDSVAVRGSIGKGNALRMGGGSTGIKMFVENLDERNPMPADLEVSVPMGGKIWVKTATANVEVTGVTGSLDIYVVSGNITVTGSPADVNAEAMDGSIRIVGSPAWIRAKSASGDVSLDGSSPDVTLSTVSGKIDADGTRFEKAEFESVTGSIRFAGSFARGGMTTFETHSGSIEIGIAAGSPADFDVVSIGGKIDNRLTKTRPVAGRFGRGSELSTSSGDGGTRVVVRTFKGTVILLPKD